MEDNPLKMDGPARRQRQNRWKENERKHKNTTIAENNEERKYGPRKVEKYTRTAENDEERAKRWSPISEYESRARPRPTPAVTSAPLKLGSNFHARASAFLWPSLACSLLLEKRNWRRTNKPVIEKRLRKSRRIEEWTYLTWCCVFRRGKTRRWGAGD